MFKLVLGQIGYRTKSRSRTKTRSKYSKP